MARTVRRLARCPCPRRGGNHHNRETANSSVTSIPSRHHQTATHSHFLQPISMSIIRKSTQNFQSAGTPRTLPVLKRQLAGRSRPRPASKAFGTAEEGGRGERGGGGVGGLGVKTDLPKEEGNWPREAAAGDDDDSSSRSGGGSQQVEERERERKRKRRSQYLPPSLPCRRRRRAMVSPRESESGCD